MKAVVARAFRLPLVLAPLAVVGCSLVFSGDEGRVVVSTYGGAPIADAAAAGWRATVSDDGEVVLRYTGVDYLLDTGRTPPPHVDPDSVYVTLRDQPGALPTFVGLRGRSFNGFVTWGPPNDDVWVYVQSWDLDGYAVGVIRSASALYNNSTAHVERSFRVDLSAADATFD